MRVLFICKNNETYGVSQYSNKASGLFNSTRFIVEQFNKLTGFDAKIVDVVDNNDIDREVTQFRPNIVVIEALWVVPEKFDTLKNLHPKVKWFVHLHSNIPFLALEGCAIEWIYGYQTRNVGVITNSQNCFDALVTLIEEVFYLPNVYANPMMDPVVDNPQKAFINVGCFGAIRPFKNTLIQAMAALQFAKDIGRMLRFHINGNRLETNGDPCLKNLVELFYRQPGGTQLVPHKWFAPKDFVQYLHEHIDIGMQVSLSETFNVVSADYVTAGLPLVVSREVYWVKDECFADTDSITSIVKSMHRVWDKRWLFGREWLILENQRSLSKHAREATASWAEFFQLTALTNLP